MHIGILQFDLHIHDARSIKDKRRVVSSLKDRLHREHQASVAEVALQDRMGVARLGLAIVGGDGRRLGQVLDQITLKLRSLHEAELGDVSRQIIHNTEDLPASECEESDDPELAAELLRRAEEDPE